MCLSYIIICLSAPRNGEVHPYARCIAPRNEKNISLQSLRNSDQSPRNDSSHRSTIHGVPGWGSPHSSLFPAYFPTETSPAPSRIPINLHTPHSQKSFQIHSRACRKPTNQHSPNLKRHERTTRLPLRPKLSSNHKSNCALQLSEFFFMKTMGAAMAIGGGPHTLEGVTCRCLQ